MNATLDIRLVHFRAFAELFVIAFYLCSKSASRQLQPEALKPAPPPNGSRRTSPRYLRRLVPSACRRRSLLDLLLTDYFYVECAEQHVNRNNSRTLCQKARTTMVT